MTNTLNASSMAFDPRRYVSQQYIGNHYEMDKASHEALQQSEFTPGYAARIVAGQDAQHDLVLCGAMGRDLVATRLRMSHRALKDRGLVIVQCMAGQADNVFVVVNVLNQKPVIIEDGMDMFPSDELVTKLRTLMP